MDKRVTLKTLGSNRNSRGVVNFPRNAWYAAAGGVEIGEKLLARRICDVPLVFYRLSNGDPVALHDRCPHRLTPLSLGNRLGDEIQCIYHGMQFDGTGACTKIPSQDVIPPQMATRRFPLVERGMYAWIWMGDPEKADPALIPDAGYVKASYSNLFHLYAPAKADYVRLHENLMDTSHPSFLHPGIFDDGGQLASASYRVEAKGNMIRLTRDLAPRILHESLAGFFQIEPGTLVKQEFISETYAPCLNTIISQFTFPNEPDRPMVQYVGTFPVIPVGPRECAMFFASSATWKLEASPQLDSFFHAIWEGDVLALEAIEERLDDAQSENDEVSVRADAPSLRMRNLLLTMAAEDERAFPSSRKETSAPSSIPTHHGQGAAQASIASSARQES